MPRRLPSVPVPLHQRPRTRANVLARGLPLVALPANGMPAHPPPPPRALPPPAQSPDFDVESLDIGPQDHGNHHQPAHIEHVFRGQTTLILRRDWEDPVFMAALRAGEEAVRERERRERLRRQREGGRGRFARRAAFKRGGARLRIGGRFASAAQVWVVEFNQWQAEWDQVVDPNGAHQGLGLVA